MVVFVSVLKPEMYIYLASKKKSSSDNDIKTALKFKTLSGTSFNLSSSKMYLTGTLIKKLSNRIVPFFLVKAEGF